MNQGTAEALSGRWSGQRLAPWVIAMTLLLPIVLVIVVFPTPVGDMREQIAWGRHFPLVTPHHPPMMVWLSGAVDLLFGPALLPQMILGQALVLVGIIYVAASLRLVTGPANAFLFTFLYATTLCIWLAPLSWAMNADFLQVTVWPAVLYHFLRAVRSDKWLHWLALGFYSAAAVLSKYTAVVLFAAMTIAVLWLPTFRSVLTRARLYVAVLLAALLVAPHLVALVKQPASLVYGADKFDAGVSLARLVGGALALLGGYFLLLFPAWLVVPIGLWRRDLGVRRPDRSSAEWPPAVDFVLVVNLAILVLLLGLIVFGGLNYLSRFDAPLAGLLVVALAPLFAWNPERQQAGETWMVRGIGLLNLTAGVLMAIIYVFFTADSIKQEAYAKPTATVLSDWHSRYACGPAYVIGDRRAAQLIGIHAGGSTSALATRDIRRGVAWFDPADLRKRGAIVISNEPIDETSVHEVVPDAVLTKEQVFDAPLLRTRTGETLTYHYRFIPPGDCPK